MAVVERDLHSNSPSVLPHRRETATPYVRLPSLSRRHFFLGVGKVGVTAALGAIAFRREAAEYVQTVYEEDEFTKGAVPYTREEIEEDNDIEHSLMPELEIPGGTILFEGKVEGPGTDVILTLPGLVRPTPAVTAVDIHLDGEYTIRAGILSSPEPEPKRVLLGPLTAPTVSDPFHEFTIELVDTTEEEPIDPNDLTPTLTYSVTPNSLRSRVNRHAAFVLPRSGRPPLNDLLVATTVVPYHFGENLGIIEDKINTAEDSLDTKGEWERQWKKYERLYDRDWIIKKVISPTDETLQLFVQKNSHKTQEYDLDYFLFDGTDFLWLRDDPFFMYGTHPVLETYTSNGMVRAANYHNGLPHFRDEPKILSYAERKRISDDKVIDPYLQYVSFAEYDREKENQETLEELQEDFSQSTLDAIDKE